MSQNAAAAWAQQAERERLGPFTDPIEIPAATSSGPRWVAVAERGTTNREEDHQEDDVDGDAAVPPHVLLARRRAASSVCSGQGRTLKGRDLRRVRDSVLRMTGFIES